MTDALDRPGPDAPDFWLDVNPDSLRWELQRSTDGGDSWATDWAIDDRRR